MTSFDTVIIGGRLVTPDGEVQKDLGLRDGKIAAIEEGLLGQGTNEITAENTYVIPGIIDSHVHLNEPGNTDWEGFETGSKAALAGGVTCLFDMPLNSLPTTVSSEALEVKKQSAAANCKTDYSLWGGLIPGNIDALEPLYEGGVIGFKGFMANSGLNEFPCVDKTALKAGMEVIAKLPGMRLALHAEDDNLTSELSRRCVESGATSYQDFLNSRPIEAELLAIRMAIDIAGETRCPVHIVHVTCAEGIDLISQAKKAGVDISVETCPHYLSLTSNILETAGPIAKCAPPLRNSAAAEALQHKVRTGEIDTIGSDHSPCPESMKTAGTFFDAWGGISSLQHAGPISYSLLYKTLAMPLTEIAKLTSTYPAHRFSLPDKGSITIGYDADLAIIDFENRDTIKKEDLFYKNPHTPYLGMTPPYQIHSTLVRGQEVYANGEFIDDFRGQFIQPAANRHTS